MTSWHYSLQNIGLSLNICLNIRLIEELFLKSSCVLTARIFLLFNLSSAAQYIHIHLTFDLFKINLLFYEVKSNIRDKLAAFLTTKPKNKIIQKN